MAGLGSSLGGFLAELRRRNVLRVLGIYAITVWVILQIAADTFPPFGIAPWVHASLIIALVAGFPLVAVLSWVFDITPDGIVRTGPAPYEDKLNEFGEAISGQPRIWIDMLIIVTLLGMVTYLLMRPGDPDPGMPEPSIAVLPFMDISEHGDNEYFSDGLTEALISTLAKLPGLKVASATSSFAYKGTHPDIKHVGERLGVASVLEGSVRKAADNTLKVTAQLIDARTNFHLWSETFDGDMDDIFKFQEQIARSIATVLHLNLATVRAELMDIHVTDDIDAYDHYLRGRAELRSALTISNLTRAIGYFEEAIRIDPRFGLADAGLCTAYWEMYDITRDDSYIELAMESCHAAVARVRDMPDLHAALGALYTGTGRHDQALEAYDRALTLDPGHAEALRGVGIVQWRTGRLDEAERTLRRAIDSDPAYWRSYASLGALMSRTGRFAESAQAFTRGIERNPGHPHLHLNLGAAYGAQGDFGKAADAFRASASAYPSAAAYANLGSILLYQGEYEEAREMYVEALELAPGQYELHQSLADACRYIPGGTACAERHYRTALDLAKARVAVAPGNARAVADLALLHARTGDFPQAHRTAALIRERGYTGYDLPRALAVIHLIEGDREMALEQLAKARDNGYPAFILAVHPDFEPLRGDERFRMLVADEGS